MTPPVCVWVQNEPVSLVIIAISIFLKIVETLEIHIKFNITQKSINEISKFLENQSLSNKNII
jgi:hypothetical protein